MTDQERSDIKGMIAAAEAKGKALESLEERNRKRRAKGRKPLMEPSEKEDRAVLLRKHRTGDPTTVAGEDAIKLFEMRKADMSGEGFEDDDEEELPEVETPSKRRPVKSQHKASEKSEEAAVREAEAARRIQDMKNGRIDHAGNWSESGQQLEGGDATKLTGVEDAKKAWGVGQVVNEEKKEGVRPPIDLGQQSYLDEFKKDLYSRLGTSFESIERTLSDLQGRVAEIVTASAKHDESPEDSDMKSEFEDLLTRKTPVVFDVGGTQMTFDAITVFYAKPCITIVSKIGSAKITPKPGATLFLSYEMDGQKLTNDPVTFLGTRFDLPMFGLSFVGFIRDNDADLIDAAAGVNEQEP